MWQPGLVYTGTGVYSTVNFPPHINSVKSYVFFYKND